MPHGGFYDFVPAMNGHDAGEVPDGIKLAKEVNDPKLNQEEKDCARFL